MASYDTGILFSSYSVIHFTFLGISDTWFPACYVFFLLVLYIVSGPSLWTLLRHGYSLIVIIIIHLTSSEFQAHGFLPVLCVLITLAAFSPFFIYVYPHHIYSYDVTFSPISIHSWIFLFLGFVATDFLCSLQYITFLLSYTYYLFLIIVCMFFACYLRKVAPLSLFKHSDLCCRFFIILVMSDNIILVASLLLTCVYVLWTHSFLR